MYGAGSAAPTGYNPGCSKPVGTFPGGTQFPLTLKQNVITTPTLNATTVNASYVNTELASVTGGLTCPFVDATNGDAGNAQLRVGPLGIVPFDNPKNKAVFNDTVLTMNDATVNPFFIVGEGPRATTTKRSGCIVLDTDAAPDNVSASNAYLQVQCDTAGGAAGNPNGSDLWIQTLNGASVPTLGNVAQVQSSNDVYIQDFYQTRYPDNLATDWPSVITRGVIQPQAGLCLPEPPFPIGPGQTDFPVKAVPTGNNLVVSIPVVASGCTLVFDNNYEVVPDATLQGTWVLDLPANAPLGWNFTMVIMATPALVGTDQTEMFQVILPQKGAVEDGCWAWANWMSNVVQPGEVTELNTAITNANVVPTSPDLLFEGNFPAGSGVRGGTAKFTFTLVNNYGAYYWQIDGYAQGLGNVDNNILITPVSRPNPTTGLRQKFLPTTAHPQRNIPSNPPGVQCRLVPKVPV